MFIKKVNRRVESYVMIYFDSFRFIQGHYDDFNAIYILSKSWDIILFLIENKRDVRSAKVCFYFLFILTGGPTKCGNEDLPKNFACSTNEEISGSCLLYTSPSPRDKRQSRMPSSA